MGRQTTAELLVDIVGEEAAARLIESFGGTRVYVPVRSAPEHPLAQAVGLDAAEQLAREFGGEVLLVPMSTARPDRRAEMIREMHARGLRTAEIARAARCSERWVYRVLSEKGGDGL